jgi:hypothetical protein
VFPCDQEIYYIFLSFHLVADRMKFQVSDIWGWTKSLLFRISFTFCIVINIFQSVYCSCFRVIFISLLLCFTFTETDTYNTMMEYGNTFDILIMFHADWYIQNQFIIYCKPLIKKDTQSYFQMLTIHEEWHLNSFQN